MKRYVLALIVAVWACAGPNMYFDPAPAPSWIHRASCTMDPVTGRLTAVGSTPATTRVDEDLRLAKYDAISKVARMISSEVSSTTTVWQVQASAGSSLADRSILQKDIRVRSRIRVADVMVRAHYRDKATGTAYVLIAVDTRAWVHRIERRLKRRLRMAREQLRLAGAMMQQRRPLRAYAHLMVADRQGAATNSDLIVLGVLQRDNQTGNRMMGLKRKIHALLRELKNDTVFSMRVDCPLPDAAAMFRNRIQNFLARHGMRTSGNGRYRVVIKARVFAQYKGPHRVANRVEQVFRGLGNIRVLDADGEVVGPLSFGLPRDTYTARAINRQAAYKQAVTLAADMLQAGLKSRFRQTFFQPGAENLWE